MLIGSEQVRMDGWMDGGIGLHRLAYLSDHPSAFVPKSFFYEANYDDYFSEFLDGIQSMIRSLLFPPTSNTIRFP